MMKRTATVQVNLDYRTPTTPPKMRALMSVTSLLTALFANSPVVDGALTGYQSYRARIWLDTDPDRCGLLPFVFEDGAPVSRLHRVGARRADVLRPPRRVPAGRRDDLPPLPARGVRGRARHLTTGRCTSRRCSRRRGSRPVPRGARRRRGASPMSPRSALWRGCSTTATPARRHRAHRGPRLRLAGHPGPTVPEAGSMKPGGGRHGRRARRELYAIARAGLDASPGRHCRS